MHAKLFSRPWATRGAVRIACLRWGSLIWDPRGLPIRRQWFEDGPFAPVEFTRKSSDGRITLVIDPDAIPVRLLWAHMVPTDLPEARQALGDREDIEEGMSSALIGSWCEGEDAPATIPDLPTWAKTQGLDAVVWTALGPKFHGDDASPSAEKVIEYLHGLRGTLREHAERYVRCAPRQIDTEYRRRIEAVLGWSYWVVVQFEEPD